jgi:phage gp46-like protein
MGTSYIRPSGLGDYQLPSAWAADVARAPGDIGIMDEAGTIEDVIALPTLADLVLRATADVRIEHATSVPLTIGTGTTGLVLEATAGHLLTLAQTGGGVVPAMVFGAASGFAATRVRWEGSSVAVSGPAVSSGAVRVYHCSARATAGNAWYCPKMEDLVLEDTTFDGTNAALLCNTWAGSMLRVKLFGGVYPWASAALQCGWCGSADMVLVDMRSADTASGGVTVWNVDRYTIPVGATVRLHHVNLVGTTAYALANDYGLLLDESNTTVGTLEIRNLQVTGFKYPWRTTWTADGHDYCNCPGAPLNGVAPADDTYTNKTWAAGAHDRAVDPGYADAAGGDYRLVYTSECLAAGLGVGVTADIDGTAWGAPPPIGCYAAAPYTETLVPWLPPSVYVSLGGDPIDGSSIGLLPTDGEPEGAKLVRAVWLSLLCHRTAEPDDALPDPSGDPPDRRGWWGDSDATVPGDRFGSRLWLLYRTRGADVPGRAEEYVREALQWLLDDGLASVVTCSATPSGNRLDMDVRIYRTIKGQGAPVRLSWDLWGGL